MQKVTECERNWANCIEKGDNKRTGFKKMMTVDYTFKFLKFVFDRKTGNEKEFYKWEVWEKNLLT